MKYAVLGAGAMGAVVGGFLARGGHDVELWDVNQPHIDAINARGLTMDLPTGTEQIKVPACRPEEGGKADAILVLTKTLHTQPALASIKPHIERGASVLGLQNGLGNAETLAAQVPEDQCLIGITKMPGRYHGPGHVSTQGTGSTIFRALSDAGIERAKQIATEVPGLSMIHDQNGAEVIIWQKAAFNCAMNAITALQGGTVGDLAQNADGVALAKETASEVVAVANAKGVGLAAAAAYEQIDWALANHGPHKPSMLQDMEAGRATEIEALCGEVSRQAAKLGVKTPINDTLAVLVRLKSSVQRERNA